MQRKILPFLILVFLFGGACRLLQPAETAETPVEQQAVSTPVLVPTSAEQASQPAEATPADGAATEAALPSETTAPSAMEALIDQTLALRSVNIRLDLLYPAGNALHVTAEVDAEGNYHLKKQFEGGLPEGFPDQQGSLPDGTELMVVQGQAYGLDQDGNWVQAEETGLEGQLESLLSGSNGPGLWIRVLPKGSLAAQGTEAIGGFQAKKYAVQADLEGAAITGSIWVDQDSQALVGAELVIPGGLVSSSDQPAEDPFKINFHVEQADVPAITADGN